MLNMAQKQKLKRFVDCLFLTFFCHVGIRPLIARNRHTDGIYIGLPLVCFLERLFLSEFKVAPTLTTPPAPSLLSTLFLIYMLIFPCIYPYFRLTLTLMSVSALTTLFFLHKQNGPAGNGVLYLAPTSAILWE